jgi:hypothetical protein
MAKSPEYPDLTWVEPASWEDVNRTSVQFIVIHDTEGSSHAQSAEDGAAYDARRTDGTSTHYFVDNDSIVQCVRTNDVAYAAFWNGNQKGIQYELCAKASFSKATWLDSGYGLPMLQRAAVQVARDCKKWGIPVRKITSSQMAAGQKGICGHGDVSVAYPQDNGDHTDPGPNFPWTEFIAMVQDEREWLDMPSVDDIAQATAQATAYKIDEDMGNPKSGIAKKIAANNKAAAQENASKVYLDLRNDGTLTNQDGTKVPGPSGIRDQVDKIIDGKLDPIEARMTSLESKVDQLLALLQAKK